VTNAVWVTVVSGMPDMLVIGITVGAAAVIVVAGVLIYKKR